MKDLNHLPPDLFSRNTIIAYLAGKICKKVRPGILDVGGRNGRLNEFFGDCSKYVILDKQESPDDFAKNTNTGNADEGNSDADAEQVAYKQADAKKIPFSDRNFDVVIASDMLEHVTAEDRPQVIKELLRVSKNCLIIGAPLNNNMTQVAEDLVRSQYYANTGVEHPFLIEHDTVGLPDEEQIDAALNQAGAAFIKIREGNLMNWYLQQLYTGTFSGGMENFEKYGFYTFFNEHLFELGALRPPIYRTIYCVLKDGEIPSVEIQTELQAKYTWSSETFMQLMKIAFDDLRFLINGRSEALLSIEKTASESEKEIAKLTASNTTLRGELESTLVKAKKAIEIYQSAIKELREFLREKEQVLNFMKNIIVGNDAKIEALTTQTNEQKEIISGIDIELRDKEKAVEKMSQHLSVTEKSLQEVRHDLDVKSRDLIETKTELENYKKSLNEVLNSRAWKAVMAYSRVKIALIGKPSKMIKKGWNIFRHLGPKIFWQRLVRKVLGKKTGAVGKSDYDQYVEQTMLLPATIKFIKKQMDGFDYKPLISIVMPVYNVDEKWLVKAIESVRGQIYEKWELCICDDASTLSHIKPILGKYAKKDTRIKVIYRQKNGGIAKASNDALNIATGAYVGLLDNDDMLAPEALYEVISHIQETHYDLIYSDEDKILADGGRTEPFFKPDWSPDLLLSCNYICHFGVYRRKILTQIGGFREGFEGSQDYDLVLRFTEKTQSIKHIPSILYHWRKVAGSAAEDVNAKPYAYESAKKALADAIKHRKIDGEVLDGKWLGSYRIKRTLTETPLVSIIIPFRDNKDILEKCIGGIFAKTTYPNYEIILVNNRSELFETAKYIEELAGEEKIKVLNFDAPFNYSAINNFAVQNAAGEYIVLLNNDIEIISPDWIESMLEHAQRPEVGAVGVKLLYPNDTIQHAGVLLGLGGLAGHAFSRHISEGNVYFGMTNVIRNYSSVTAACMMVRKEVYKGAGGLNEENLAVSFNDVDFCLRLREQGYLIIYTPYSTLYHHESLTRGYDINIREVEYVQRRHAGMLSKGDPYYNKNLTLERADFSLRCMDRVQE